MPDSERVDRLLRGSIDLHIHSAPDVVPRRMDDFELAEDAARVGMCAIVLKCHHNVTPARATLVSKHVSGIRVVGSAALNTGATGGLNDFATRIAIQLGARFIWMPTFSAANHVRYTSSGRAKNPANFAGAEIGPGISVLDAFGELVPQAVAILKVAAEENIGIGTGHLSPPECDAVVRKALELGVMRLVLTHPDAVVVGMPLQQQRELVAKGVYVERCFLETTKLGAQMSMASFAQSIRTAGVERTILSTDFGQPTSPTPVEGMRSMITGLVDQGFSDEDIEVMVKRNPAEVLGLAG